MLTTSLFVFGGLVLLAIGAEGLVRGSTSIALRLGVSPLVIGLTVVAFGTSSPELFVSVEAAYHGNSGIVLGNVVGSNISNIALILGVSALARPMRVRSELIRREMPLMIAVTLLLCLLLIDGVLSRVDGLILVAGAVAYTVFAYVSARRDHSAAVAAEFAAGIKELHRPAWLDTVFVISRSRRALARGQAIDRRGDGRGRETRGESGRHRAKCRCHRHESPRVGDLGHGCGQRGSGCRFRQRHRIQCLKHPGCPGSGGPDPPLRSARSQAARHGSAGRERIISLPAHVAGLPSEPLGGCCVIGGVLRVSVYAGVSAIVRLTNPCTSKIRQCLCEPVAGIFLVQEPGGSKSMMRSLN